MFTRGFKMSTSAMSLGAIARRCPCGVRDLSSGQRVYKDLKQFVWKLSWSGVSVREHISLPLSSCRQRIQVRRDFSARALASGSSARSSERSVWDEAADSYFSRSSSKASNVRDYEVERDNAQKDSGSDGTDQKSRMDVKRWREASSNGARAKPSREGNSRSDSSDAFSEGGRSWRPPENASARSKRYERGGGEKTMQWQKLRQMNPKMPRNWGDSRGGSGELRRNDERAGKWTRSESGGRMRRKGSETEVDEGADSDGYSGWPSSNPSAKLRLEGEVLYGVAPISNALSVVRRKAFCLYMQENLLQNIERGKRKDKAAVLFIEKTARDMGLEIRTTSKHDLNLLVDNRPHQGLVLDASPLELVQVDMLDFPQQTGSKMPVWVALDEVTDPQNFGAILRSTYFLGAEGVIVCAKNSAPLSAVVSKASAGAMEVMEVHYCKNMVKFLNGCQENGWRVVGAAAERASVAVEELSNGIPTILVLGNEGTGLRTNVKSACDHLVSIGGHSRQHIRSNNVDDGEKDDLGSPVDDGEGWTEKSLDSVAVEASVLVDSLNVSVAAGIMLHKLLSSSNNGECTIG